MKQKLRNGKLITTGNRQNRVLSFLYGTKTGRILLKPMTLPLPSVMAGAFLSTKASKIFIKPFIKNNNIDMSQFEDRDYKNYNEFFARKIKPDSRTVDFSPSSLISPCDSKLTALRISSGLRFTLKHTLYSVASLLKEDTLAKEYSGGYALIFRLTVDDYHRYCYIDDGFKGENVKIKGKFHTVMPIANDYFPIYKENSREYSILHSTNFGDVVMMEVGAMMVGRIVNHHDCAEVKRGEEKGYFQFGGSTIVLLFKENTIEPDSDILENSLNGIETVVKYGEKIGVKI